MKLRLVTMAALVAGTLIPSGTSAQVGGLPATIVDYENVVPLETSFPVFDSAGESKGKARWRVVAKTGNCCENYFGASAKGRLFDFGGSFIRYSDDMGKKWKEVRSISPVTGGEGAISGAPGGDIVGATWDPYSGDHAVAFKYDSATETWLHQELVFHTPFFDRPWFGVIPGPFTVGSFEAPYLTVLKGGWPSKDLAYYSLDGLNYFLPTESDSTGLLGEDVQRWLDVKPNEGLDWTQPNTNTGIAPLGQLGALWHSTDQIGFTNGETRSLMTPPDAEWKRFSFPTGKFPQGRFLADSRGWLHTMAPNFNEGIARSYTYSISTNGGRDWSRMQIRLPRKHIVEEWDFKANGKLGIAALAVHAHRNHKKQALRGDQDLVYELNITRAQARIKNLFYVGKGDLNVGAGITSSLRFDFATVAIMRDGTLVTSFVDQNHQEPTAAILLNR